MTRAREPVASSSEHGNAPSGSKKVVNFFPCRSPLYENLLKLVRIWRLTKAKWQAGRQTDGRTCCPHYSARSLHGLHAKKAQ